MHTGYDSFWMNQYNRQEHIFNLSKNDNYSQSVLTDNFKQVQNGGHPSHFHRYIPPQSNIARSYTNDQQRTPVSQQMWQYSVCSMPLKPSYASNFHPHAGFLSQSNNSGYSPQYPQAISDVNGLRNFKNPNTSYSNCQNTGISVHTGDNQNINKQASRIRVRDVFSLNRSDISSEVINSNSNLIHQKEQHGYALNFPANVSCNTDNLSQFINYDRRNLPLSHSTAPYYHPKGMEQHQQSLQNSTTLYQNTVVHQNPESQHQVGTIRPLDKKLHLEASKILTQQVSSDKKILQSANNQNPKAQSERSSYESVNKRVKVTPKRNSVQTNNLERTDNSGYDNRLAQECSNMGSYTQIQSQQSEIGKVPSFSSNSTAPTSIGSTSENTQSPGYQHSGGQENTVIKISTPHNGQSTYITLSDCSSANKTSDLSLPCLLEANDKFFVGSSQNNTTDNSNNTTENRVTNVPQPQASEASLNGPHTPSNINNAINTSAKTAQNCHDSESNYPENMNAPPRKKLCQEKGPILDLNRENLNKFLNSTSEINSRRNLEESISRETTFQREISLTLKQENCNAKVESPIHDPDVSKEKVLFKVIKREKNPTDENTVAQEVETKSSANTLKVPYTRETKFNRVDIKESEITQPENVENSENCIRNVENGKNKSDGKRNDSWTENRPKIVFSERNYQSKINRDKLDKLIEFLKKDEQPVQNNFQLPVKKENGDNNHRKRGIDLNLNRRKLSKSLIVKNKNNWREIISMKSNKPDRKLCSGDNKSDETDENRIASEKQVKSNSSRDTQTEEEDSTKSEPKNVDGSTPKQLSERPSVRSCVIEKEDKIMNKIRDLQIAETVYCRNCCLIATIDSFWINAASGELRCLNCFKNILLKSEEIASKSITNYVNNSKGNPCQKPGEESENNHESVFEGNNENNLKDANREKESTKPEHLDVSSKKRKGVIIHEIEESTKNNENERNHSNYSNVRKEMTGFPKSSRRQSTSEDKTFEKGKNSEQTMKRSNGESFSHKVKHSEDVLKPDAKPKRSDSVSKERTPPWSSISTGSKQFSDTCEKSYKKYKPKDGSANLKDIASLEKLKKDYPSDQSLGKSNSKEHNSNSTQDMRRKSISKEEEVAEEHAKKDKRGTECSSQNRRKSESKDLVSNKFPEENPKKDARSVTESIEKSYKKISHNDNAEKERIQSTAKESCTRYKQKESNSSDELKAKSTCNLSSVDKHKITEPRKRKHSDDDIDARKIRIVEEPTKYKTSTSNGSNENITKHKNKVLENGIQSRKISTYELRRSNFSKDEENSKMEAKQDSLSNSKVKEMLKGDTTHQNIKSSENTKQKTDDWIAASRRKSKEEQVTHKQMKNEGRQVTDMFERTKSNSKERPHKSHDKDLYEERKERRKSDDKTTKDKETTDRKVKMEVESNCDKKKVFRPLV